MPLRADVAQRLRERREEIEAAIAIRVYAISDPAETEDSGYVEGLRVSLGAALEYAIEVLERGERRAPEPPPALLLQAGLAARNGIALDVVLRRYLAGNSLFSQFLVEELNAASPAGAEEIPALLREQGAVFDRLIEAVGEEHRRQALRLARSPEERRAERVRRLLDGEAVDVSELGYEFDAWHLGVVGTGAGVAPVLRALALRLDARLLEVADGKGQSWAWLGTRREVPRRDLARATATAEATLPPASALALGAPGRGLRGWRTSHRQAAAILPAVRAAGAGIAHYADLALIASLRQDRLLSSSLRELFVEPLAGGEGDETLTETLRVYFSTGRQVSSTAVSLGVSRQTVRNRLRACEERLGRQLDECALELELALALASDQHTSDRPVPKGQIAES